MFGELISWVRETLDSAGQHPVSAYTAVAIGAMVEGEILFVTAALLVSRGVLDPLGVALAGTVGASVGDQLYFYLLRGRLNRWLARFPRLANRGAKLIQRVRRNETVTVLMLRFSPGLRIALAAACAYAGVPAVKFSILNTFTCLIWAVSLLMLIVWFGPAVLGRVGISGWWAALIPAVIIVVLFKWIGHEEKEELNEKTSAL